MPPQRVEGAGEARGSATCLSDLQLFPEEGMAAL